MIVCVTSIIALLNLYLCSGSKIASELDDTTSTTAGVKTNSCKGNNHINNIEAMTLLNNMIQLDLEYKIMGYTVIYSKLRYMLEYKNIPFNYDEIKLYNREIINEGDIKSIIKSKLANMSNEITQRLDESLSNLQNLEISHDILNNILENIEYWVMNIDNKQTPFYSVHNFIFDFIYENYSSYCNITEKGVDSDLNSRRLLIIQYLREADAKFAAFFNTNDNAIIANRSDILNIILNIRLSMLSKSYICNIIDSNIMHNIQVLCALDRWSLNEIANMEKIAMEHYKRIENSVYNTEFSDKTTTQYMQSSKDSCLVFNNTLNKYFHYILDNLNNYNEILDYIDYVLPVHDLNFKSFLERFKEYEHCDLII